MSGFSKEVLHQKKEECHNHCSILDVEVNVLEGHHALPKALGGSNNPHNCIMLAGYDAYSVYGLPVPDVHEENDRKAFDQRLFLHPDTLEYVTIDKMPSDCFKTDKERTLETLERKQNKKKKKKHH